MTRITCPSCQRAFSLDESRLPMREVTFPCPACKSSVAFDRRSLVNTAAPAPAASAVEPAPAAEAEPAPVEMPASEAEELADADSGHGAQALLVGADSPALRQAAQALGFQPIHAPTAEAARDLYLQEYPPLVFLSPAQLTRPPLVEMQPLTGLSPVDRRRSYFILVADGLKTFDGTVAFLYDVNLVVAAKDLPSIRRLWHDAQIQHKKLYQAFNAAIEALR
jgi:hypothetical protein